MKRTCISLLAVALTFAGACTKNSDDKKKEGEGPGAARSTAPTDESAPVADTPQRSAVDNATIDYSFLAPVPADTPFLLAMLRPFPNDFLSYLRDGLTPLTGMAQLGISAARDGAEPMSRAILDELNGNLSVEGMKKLGITVTPKLAMYAIGWSLAIRVELADGKTFAAVLDRIEKNGGQAMPRGELGGISYRYVADKDGLFVVAIVGDQLALGVMHAAARDHVLPVLLGTEKPEKSMADAGTVQGLVSKYKLLGMAMGYFDSPALARMIMGQVSGRSKKIRDVSNGDMPEISAVCQNEITQLVGAVPRLIFGYQNVSAKGYESVFSVELRADLAREMASLQSASVDLDKLMAGQPVLAVGATLSLDAGKAFVEKKFGEFAAKPFQCEFMSDLNRDIGEAAADVKTPLPPFVAGAHGLIAVMKELQITGDKPTGKGFAALGVSDPVAAFKEMQKRNPELRTGSLEKGKSMEVPLENMPGISATVRADDRWLSFAIGEGMSDAVSSMLASKGSAKGPFFVVSYDYGALMKLGAKMSPDNDNPMIVRMTEMLGKFLGYSSTALYFTDDGVVGRARTVIR